MLAFALTAKAADDLFIARPELASDNLFNRGNADTVFRGKHLLSVGKGLVLRPDFSNLRRGKFSVSSDAAPFAVHVVNVVLISSRKDMGRITARRVIARVASDHSRGHWAVDGFPSKDVGGLSAGVFGAVFRTLHHYLTVTAFIQVSSPRPAIVSAAFLNFLPQSQFRGSSPGKIGAVVTAKLRAAAIYDVFSDVEGIKAVLTGLSDSGFMLSGHFNSPKVDLVRGIGARQRSGISLKTKPLYHKSSVSVLKNDAVQTCTPPRFQGWVNSCQGLSIRWLNQNPSTTIDHYEIKWLADGRVDRAAGSALTLSRLTGCDWASHVTITQFMATGGSCATTSTGSAPHSFPCSSCGANTNRMATRHAASFRGDLAPGTIGAAFGDQAFTTVTLTAPATPLPTQLGGVRFLIDDLEVPLFFVSPGQINFYAPEYLSEGLHSARAIAPDGVSTYGDILINANSPGIFTIESNGTGQSASVWLILSPNGLSRYRTSVDALPGERVFLLLYGSGITERVNYNGRTTGSATLRIVVNNQAKEYPALFAGLANSSVFVGLNQLNFEIPQADLWPGLTGAQLTVANFAGQTWQSNGFSIRGR